MAESETANRIEMPPGGTSVITAKLVQYLKESDTDFISDEQIAGDLGFQIGVNAGHYQQSLRACRRVLKDTGVAWHRIPSSGGLTRVHAELARDLAESASKHVRKTSHRQVLTLKGIDLKTIPDQERTKHLTLMAQHAVLSRLSTTRSAKAIEARGEFEAPSLKDMLDSFTKKRKQIEPAENGS